MPKEVAKENAPAPRTPKASLKSPIVKSIKKRNSLSPKEIQEKIGVNSGLWVQDKNLHVPTEIPESGVPMLTVAKNRIRGEEIVIFKGEPELVGNHLWIGAVLPINAPKIRKEAASYMVERIRAMLSKMGTNKINTGFIAHEVSTTELALVCVVAFAK